MGIQPNRVTYNELVNAMANSYSSQAEQQQPEQQGGSLLDQDDGGKGGKGGKKGKGKGKDGGEGAAPAEDSSLAGLGMNK